MTSPSLLNPNTTLTTEKWGVTLTQDVDSFHAKLIFEGVKEEGYFYQIAHLQGPSRCNTIQACSNTIQTFFLRRTHKGIVEIKEPMSADAVKAKLSKGQLYSKKTQTWLVSRNKIEWLIEKIKAEVDKESPFNICGSKSIFSKPAEVIEIYHPLLAEIKKHDQDLFLRLYDSAQNRGECTGMSREEFDKAISEVKKKIDAPDLNYPKLIELISAFTRTFNMYQNNCFTWCRGNLEKLGIELTDNMLEHVISVTALYVKYKPQDKISGDRSLIASENQKKTEEKTGCKLLTQRLSSDEKSSSKISAHKTQFLTFSFSKEPGSLDLLFLNARHGTTLITVNSNEISLAVTTIFMKLIKGNTTKYEKVILSLSLFSIIFTQPNPEQGRLTIESDKVVIHLNKLSEQTTALFLKSIPTSQIQESEDISAKSLHPKERAPVNLCERFVTYNLRRDRRTEEWKVIEKESKRNKAVYTTSRIATVSLTAAPLLFISPEIPSESLGRLIAGDSTARNSFLIGIAAVAVGLFVTRNITVPIGNAAKKRQNNLTHKVRSTSKFNVSGNNLQNINELVPFENKIISLREKATNAYGQVREKGIYATISSAFTNSELSLPKEMNRTVTFTFANPTNPKLVSQVTLGSNPVDSTTAKKAAAVMTGIFKRIVAKLLEKYQDDHARLMVSKQFTVSVELGENDNKFLLNIFYNANKNMIKFPLSEETSKSLKDSLATVAK